MAMILRMHTLIEMTCKEVLNVPLEQPYLISNQSVTCGTGVINKFDVLNVQMLRSIRDRLVRHHVVS